MTTYQIIEDCSPFFIRFKFDGLENLINYIKTLPIGRGMDQGSYIHKDYDIKEAVMILKRLPMYDKFQWRINRVAIFSTKPGNNCHIHKDAFDLISLNIPLTILDDKCRTAWYSEDAFGSKIPNGLPYSRAIYHNTQGYDNIPKLKVMIAKPKEMVLFNTDIYHSWENKNSTNVREILTLRLKKDSDMPFEDARKILFGY